MLKVIEMGITINFDNSFINEVLAIFDKEINKDGVIVENDSKEPVVTRQGDTIKHEDLGAIGNGSEVFVEDNFVSMLEFIKRKN